METNGISVLYICCDNSAEKVAFEWLYKKEGVVVKFEYTVSGTWQQNGRVEKKAVTLFSRVYALLNGGDFSQFLRNCLGAEAGNIAMLLEYNFITSSRDLHPFQQFFGKEKRSNVSSLQKSGKWELWPIRTKLFRGTAEIWVGSNTQSITFQSKDKKIFDQRNEFPQ